jgi:hypothetical protein
MEPTLLIPQGLAIMGRKKHKGWHSWAGENTGVGSFWAARKHRGWHSWAGQNHTGLAPGRRNNRGWQLCLHRKRRTLEIAELQRLAAWDGEITGVGISPGRRMTGVGPGRELDMGVLKRGPAGGAAPAGRGRRHGGRGLDRQ